AAMIISMAACSGGDRYAPAGDSGLYDLYSGSSSWSGMADGGGSGSGSDLEAGYDYYGQAEFEAGDSAAYIYKSKGFGTAEEQFTANAAVADYGQSTDALSDKLIYTAEVSIESLDFDETITSFLELAKEYKAFFESTYVSGMINVDAKASQPRYANYTVRVPKGHFQDMLDRFYEIGNVIYSRSHAENITTQFLDTESRLNTYRIEETRLLAMLEKTDTVDDMIKIESRLSDVRYQIESLTTTLRNWQSQVDYSTIELSIREVAKISEAAPFQQTYSQELKSGVAASFYAIGEFFKQLFKYVVVLSPLLLIAAAVVAFVVIRMRKRRAKAKKTQE
ncbi:MAG: DUF4349 domain-containing protein, partial [Clostridiales bacterium]|nr:DUF4349 domain-containing protein [Clostridiales bacterium]